LSRIYRVVVEYLQFITRTYLSITPLTNISTFTVCEGLTLFSKTWKGHSVDESITAAMASLDGKFTEKTISTNRATNKKGFQVMIKILKPFKISGRGGEIRTPDILLPKQVV
jgi:hypothetical protein